jgi:hypothetical protein
VLNWRNLSENFAVVASSGKSGFKAFSITFGFATNKIILDDSLEEGTIYILDSVLKTTSNYPKLQCSPLIECEKAWQRGYSGSTHDEIVISRAFAEAVFSRAPDDN